MSPTPTSTAITTASALTDDHRRYIFADLVGEQDAGSSVPDFRSLVAAKHGVNVAVVREVEREGLDEQWAPL